MNNEKIENLMDENPKNDKKIKKEKVNKELEKLIEEKNILNDKLLRVTAEMQNMKRRYDEEISKIYRYEGEELIKKLLVTLDNFERAISLDDDNLDDELSKFLSGFKLIYGNLKNELLSMNVKEIECMGNPFNPEMMDAVMTEKVDGVTKGLVTDVMLKGYTYNDKVIRPAMVKVSE